MTVFNCLTQGQYCPHQEVSQITMGPFVVVPVGLGRGGKSMKFKSSKYRRELMLRVSLDNY